MLNDLQERFCVEYVERHADGTAAALAAGYSNSTAHTQVSRLLSLPTVAARIAVELDKQRTVSGVIGLSVLKEIARHAAAPAAARVTAARTLMEYAGMIGGKPHDPTAGKDPSEMSAEELRTLIARLDKELGDRAMPVNAPIPTLPNSDLSDFLE